MMFGDLNYPRHTWTEKGVKQIEIGIPGETRRGVLTAEALKALQADSARTRSYTQYMVRLAGEGKWTAMGDILPQDQDLTTESIEEYSFLIPRGNEPIPVTAYCLEERWNAVKPAVVYFHGGGFRMGSRKSVENSMRLLAQLSGAMVFSVEYRLAPEYRFPCATEDAWQALRWLYRHAADYCVDKARFTVSGDSAGGNLAAACARRDRNMRTGMVHRQLLIYPVLCQMEPNAVDYHFSVEDYEICETQKKWILSCIESTKTVANGKHLYTNSAQEDRSPDASPLLDTNFAGLPRTVLFCAEFDYLTQQAKTYAQRLANSGVDVTLVLYRGMHHGFMNRLGEYPQATALHHEVASMIQCDENQNINERK